MKKPNSNKRRSKKSALLLSALSLLLSTSMLVGSTFAWFTDSVTSTGNKIQSGTLTMDLEVLTDGNWNSIKDSEAPLFYNDLWEPGHTEFRILKVENEGNLALKWVAKFTSQKELSKLAEVIDVYVRPYGVLLPTDASSVAYPADRNLDGYTKVGTLNQFINTLSATTYGELKANEAAYLGIALKMQESANNDYQNLDLGGEFDITILATQNTVEADSFGNDYDVNSAFNAVYTEGAVFTEGLSSVDVEIRNSDRTKIASVLVPAAAVDEGETEIKVVVMPCDANSNIVVSADQEVLSFDISVLGLKKGNIAPITVEIRLPANLDPATIKLYHYDQLIDSSYDPNSGYVTFQTTNFSPFTVLYDADSEYIAPEEDTSLLPKAIVTSYTDTDNIEWGKYGQWSPTEGLEANLESAYTFQCKETAAEAALNPYANWYCDFYVMLDKDLGENQIFLGGNYGSFGWVGFHNGELTLPANTEIGLLESVTTNPWTYLDVASYVGTFICGVGDVDNALNGATFTVMLRLTNPENPNEYYNIHTEKYTFTTVVNSGDELQDAINNGDTNISLGGDIDLSQGIIIP